MNNPEILPLAGITVVALEQAVAVPFATRQLADLGARVIKIERPEKGDFARGYDDTVRGMSSYFVWLNRSKESLTLDLKAPLAREALRRLLATADVCIQNLAPGAMERLGFGTGRLRTEFPRLVVCDVSGYGGGGPFAKRKAYDLLIQCEIGLVSIAGTQEDPAKVPISIADIAAGMYAFSGILVALYQRLKDGKGRSLEISLLEALGEWMGYPFYYTFYGGIPPARTGSRHASIAPYGAFSTSDGSLFIGIQNSREWLVFCNEILELPDLADDPRFATNVNRVRHESELTLLLNESLRKLPVSLLTSRLDRSGIAYSSLNSIHQWISHPQLQARQRLQTVCSPVGSLQALLPPINLEGFTPRMDPIPALGEHTASILSSLGFSEKEMAALNETHALATSQPKQKPDPEPK